MFPERKTTCFNATSIGPVPHSERAICGNAMLTHMKISLDFIANEAYWVHFESGTE